MPSPSDNYTSSQQDIGRHEEGPAIPRPGNQLVTAGEETHRGDRELGKKGRNTRSRLLASAVDVFERRGYHATRVDDIVKLAKTSHGTYYIYFTNKEDVFRALIADAANEIDRAARSLGPLRPGAGRLESLRNWIGDLAATYQRFAPVIRAWTEGAADDADIRSSGIEMTKSIISIVTEQFRSGAASTGASLDPRSAAIAVVAMIERCFYYQLRSREDEIPASMLDTLAAIVDRGVFGST